MTLRQAAFRAVVATVVVLAAAVAAVGEAPQTLASTQSPIAVIGDSYTTGSDEGGNGYGQRGSRGGVGRWHPAARQAAGRLPVARDGVVDQDLGDLGQDEGGQGGHKGAEVKAGWGERAGVGERERRGRA